MKLFKNNIVASQFWIASLIWISSYSYKRKNYFILLPLPSPLILYYSFCCQKDADCDKLGRKTPSPLQMVVEWHVSIQARSFCFITLQSVWTGSKAQHLCWQYPNSDFKLVKKSEVSCSVIGYLLAFFGIALKFCFDVCIYMRTCSPKPQFFLYLMRRDFAAVHEIKNQKLHGQKWNVFTVLTVHLCLQSPEIFTVLAKY